MSKNVLNNICTSAQKDSYSWALYFFKIDKRAKQPFKTNKVRFKNDIYLLQYARNLLNATKTYQVDQISEVQDYDGENSKVSCDKLLLTNELVSEQWKLFTQAVATSSDQKIKENDMGDYIAELLNRLIIVIPALLLGIAIGKRGE